MLSLVQRMACRLFGDNPLSEPMFYCQLDSKEHISIIFYFKFRSFYSRKCIWRCCLQIWRPSFLSLNVLNQRQVYHGEIFPCLWQMTPMTYLSPQTHFTSFFVCQNLNLAESLCCCNSTTGDQITVNFYMPWQHRRFFFFFSDRDYSVHEPSQLDTMLHCNIVSHWLGVYTKWSL